MTAGIELPESAKQPQVSMAQLRAQLDQWAAMQAELGPHIEKMFALEEDIKTAVRLLGGPVEHPQVIVNYRPPTSYTRFDAKALEGYFADKPELRQQFELTTNRSASVGLKLK